jgi:UDP-N-acetylglucosamine 2-epimerase
MKIISLVGARPQFIKLAPLSKLLGQYHDEVVVHTGQHYDDPMSNRIFRDLKIKIPKYNLGVGSGTHNMQTGKILCQLDKVIQEEKPDLVIVFGDTNSTVAGALAATKALIPVIHIEAGLRSYNRKMPEEINRIATDHISDHLFAPTQNALQILEKEGLKERSYLTGDIMVDTINQNKQVASQRSDVIKNLDLTDVEFYLLTLHRPYNVDDPVNLQNILFQLGGLDKKVVFPCHPRTEKIIRNNHLKISNNIFITEPQGYLDFLNLEQNAYKIITDSGGIQKEAYILKKPCLTLRTETEWLETIDEGWNKLIDIHKKNWVAEVAEYNPTEQQNNVFGDNIAENMVEIINKLNPNSDKLEIQNPNF